MRIELNSGGLGGISTISNMQESIDSLLQKSEALVSALQSIRSYTYSMNGGVGILQDAVSNLDARLQAEEAKKSSLTSTKTKIGSFMEYVVKIDAQVADAVDQNQEEFYRVNGWARPSAVVTIIESWYSKVKKWLLRGFENATDYLTHSWNVYNEIDFASMTTSELQKYSEELLERITSGESDDVIRLKALFEYVSKHSIQNKSLYITLFEQIYPEKMQAIKKVIDESMINYSDEQKFAMMYYMANGTSKNTALTLWYNLKNSNNIIGDQYELMQFKHGEGFYQGNFWIGNFNVSESTDGSCVIKAVAHQSPVAKSEGVVLVYNEFGDIIDVQVLNRYKNPTDFVSAVQTIWKDWHGKDYEETAIDIKVPKGGYARITDDPNVLEYVKGDILDKKIQQGIDQATVDDALKNAVDLTSDDVKVIGTSEPSYVEYGETASDYAALFEEASKLVDVLETRFWSNRQKGSGSCYIYNH